MSGPRESGDAWVVAQDGNEYWGRFGSAGVLLCHTDDTGLTRYFLTHRSPEVHHGDTWGLPGGALERDEPVLEGALRELYEELGLELEDYVVKHEHVSSPAPDWSYTTLVLAVPQMVEVDEHDDWETSDSGWFTAAELKELPLHPAFDVAFHSGAFERPLLSALHTDPEPVEPVGPSALGLER